MIFKKCICIDEHSYPYLTCMHMILLTNIHIIIVFNSSMGAYFRSQIFCIKT